jgi:hypothetical protein
VPEKRGIRKKRALFQPEPPGDDLFQVILRFLRQHEIIPFQNA